MSVLNTIRQRRSHRSFTTQPVNDDDIRTMLEAAIMAPNHKLTEPWGFVVLGKLSRRRYAEIKAASKVGSEADAQLAAAKRAKILAETSAIPAVIVVTQKLNQDPHRMKEDYAAVFMAIQNMLLVATSMGLGSKIVTGKIIDEQPMRELVGAGDDERIAAIVHLGEPTEEVRAPARTAVADKTRWLP